MIALTNRLNEWDETIIYLQEELDAYDKIHWESELNLDIKQDRIKYLEDFIQMNGFQIPESDDQLKEFKHQHMQLKRYTPYESEDF